VSVLSSKITTVPQLLQIYLPLPGFSPVVGIISPLFNFYKSNIILAEGGEIKKENMGLIYRTDLMLTQVNTILTIENY